MKHAAIICCAMTMAVLTACTSDNDDNPVSGVDSKIVGNNPQKGGGGKLE